jgi:hypothetical protein
VVARYTERGKSVKPFRGLGPTNKTHELLAMEWFEVNNLIQRRWGTRFYSFDGPVDPPRLS